MTVRQQQIVTTLRQRVHSGLHLGLLRYGDRLPSVRELARELATDPRVVIAAYQTLEQQGVVELRPRSGVYVAMPVESATAVPRARVDWLVDLLTEGIGFGVSAVEFPERVRRCMETLRLRALVLECNDDQLFSVSDELARDYGLEVQAVDIGIVGDRTGTLPFEARRADCIVTTELHAEAAATIAQAIEVPSIVVTMCDDLFAEVGRLLQDRPVYFVVSDPRFESKLHGVFAANRARGNLRVLVHERDDVTRIPNDAPTYLTRLTRRALGTLPLLERLLPEARVFSARSARDIVAFIVRANLRVLEGQVRGPETAPQ